MHASTQIALLLSSLFGRFELLTCVSTEQNVGKLFFCWLLYGNDGCALFGGLAGFLNGRSLVEKTGALTHPCQGAGSVLKSGFSKTMGL